MKSEIVVTGMMENEVVSVKPIKKLEEVVINRIAAGEVIQRPANALKELIENCLDAKSTSIQIIVKEGGLKLLQIQDNGCGIRPEDMNIVCERFTTSKLQKFEDLQNMSTYGFRGEALASISHIAHVTIKTKTVDSKCAFQASYVDGKPSGPPKPCAGNQGTLILVEDLFFNVPIRRKAFTNYSVEYAKVADIVTRYAIHNASVSFSLKKDGNTVSSIKTLPNATALENIKMFFGTEISRELLEVSHENPLLNFKLSGHISSSNYSASKATFIFFINHRLVESTALRKAIDAVYTTYLPKHKFPFTYISLEIAPQNIDVNVHPTKQEVHFLHESSIVEDIQKVVESHLLNTNHSRTMYLQTLLPSTSTPLLGEKEIVNIENNGATDKRTLPYHMVRTDSKDQKLDAFIPKIDFQESSGALSQDNGTSTDPQIKSKATLSKSSNRTLTNTVRRRQIELDSVLNLRKEIEKECDADLKRVFSELTFVGCVTRQHSLIQHQTKLYLINTHTLSQELFYQIIMRDFGNFSALRLSEPASIRDLALLALDNVEGECIESYESKEQLADYIVTLLKSKAEMLNDYFSLEIDKDGMLCSIPYLLENYFPSLIGLPLYILHLANDVDWDSETECFKTLALTTSHFYAFSKDVDIKTSKEEKADSSQTDISNTCKEQVESSLAQTSWKWVTEHVIFSTFRKIFQPSKQDAKNGTVLQVANLTDLYKVFERC